jgi:flavin-dependent dehydrogenase
MDLLDVAVVGGGQASLAIARRLRRLGLRFLVLDASPEIGQAGSVSGSASHPKPALPIGQAQQ